MMTEHIELDIIKYNLLYYIIPVFIIMIYLSIAIGIYIPFQQWHIAVKITIGVFLIFFLLLRYSDLYFVKIGTIRICSKGEVLLEYIHSTKILENCAFVINYGGYKGEPKEMDIFFTGSGFRDGTRNLMTFKKNQTPKHNNKPIRLFIKSKQQAAELKLLISTMSGKGIDVSINNSFRMRLPA